MPGMTSCHSQNDIVQGMASRMTTRCAAMIIILSGQLWLVLADLAALYLCWTKRAHSADDVAHIGGLV